MSHGSVKGNDWFSEGEIQPFVKSNCDAQSPATENYV
jgi:hypothetical protein